MTTAEARQLRARLAGELGRVRALLSRVDALSPQQDGGQRRRLTARTAGGDAEAVRRDPDAAAQVQEQRVVQLPRRRRGPQAARLHGHTRPFCGACSSAAMAGAAVGDGGTRKQRGKGDAAVSPFYWGLGKYYWGLRKNIGESEIKNQSIGASFFTINLLY